MAEEKPAKEILLSRRGQITIPKEFIPEGVSQFRAVLREEDGAIILLPRVSVPAHQAYYWTKRWQKGERTVSTEIKEGRLSEPGNAADVMKAIKGKR